MNKIIIILAIVACCIACNNNINKVVSFYPSTRIEVYHVEYKQNAINISTICKKEKENETWNLSKEKGGYFLNLQNHKYLFLSNTVEQDTLLDKDLHIPQRIIIKKLNDSLYVSSLSSIIVNEVFNLEIVYNKLYDIKQIRHQAVWIDYTKEGEKAIEYTPLSIQSSKKAKWAEGTKY